MRSFLGRKFPSWWRAENQPATYPRMFLDVAVERGADREGILRRAGIERARIDDPAGRLSLLEFFTLHEAIGPSDPTLGFETGHRLPLTAHGSLGYALMCAPTARAAIGILERYWHLRGRAVIMRPREDGTFLEVLPEVEMPPWLRDQLFASMLTSMVRGLTFLVPEAANETEIWLLGDEPAGFAAYRDRLPRVRFGMAIAGLRDLGDPTRLDRPLPTANPEGLAHALAMCEHESKLMGGGADPLLVRVRTALRLGTRGYPSPAALAKALHLTPRTFRRRLQEHGTSYQTLLEEARRRDACRLLEKPALPIQRIAALLGYDDPANFTRAFRTWTGVPPSTWRRSAHLDSK